MKQQLVKITHTRCRDYDGTEYMLAPADWDSERIRGEVFAVSQEMIEDAKLLKNPPSEELHMFQRPNYEEYPDLTVREIQARHEAAKAKYRAWKEENSHLQRSLQDRLVERGFATLWGDNADVVDVDIDWSHHHGLELNYKHSNF